MTQTKQQKTKSRFTVEQRIEQANFAVMRHIKYCALSGVIMYGNTEVTDEPGVTAYTNGRDKKYGREFVEGLTDPQLRFLVLHENYHVAYRHLTTWKHLFDRDPRRANAAADHVINLGLVGLDDGEKFIEMPPKGLCDAKYRGMDTKQVFDLLGKDGGGGNGEGFDQHGWEDAQGMTEGEKRQIEVEIDRALRQGAVIAAKRKANVDRSLLGLLEPKINWREVLRDFIMTLCAGRDLSTWRKVNRRMVGNGVYMPGHISEAVGRIVLAVDTSGSIGSEDLRDFMSEVVGICKQVNPEVVDLLYWGSQVVAHEKYGVHELDTLESKTRPAGGGGTEVECVSDYLRDKNIRPECVIVLTDGHLGGGWGSWSAPVLWCIAGGNKVVASVGKTVHVN